MRLPPLLACRYDNMATALFSPCTKSLVRVIYIPGPGHPTVKDDFPCSNSAITVFSRARAITPSLGWSLTLGMPASAGEVKESVWRNDVLTCSSIYVFGLVD